MATWPQALFKLVFFIISLPIICVDLHLNHAQQRANLLFVGPVLEENHDIKKTDTFEDLYGIYHGISSPDNKNQPLLFTRAMGLPKWHVHWPSIAHVSTVLATPTSTLLRGRRLNEEMAATQIVYDTNQHKWCLQSQTHQVCSTQTDDSDAPISGIWAEGAIAIQVLYNGETHHTKSASTSFVDNSSVPKKFRRNPNKRTRRNRNLEQVLTRPTTTLLIAVNVLIALIYWNRGTPPSSVAKIYNKIVLNGEYWRSFTGATAHFEPIHLGFNMMTLYSLGTELEPSYGSVPFLFYNISLIPITTLIMMAIVYLQITITGNAALGETSTVGYSGVLFCWMVIASLERSETCQIPFLPELCFSTHHFGGFRFNIGPIVQLFVAQIIMKRVSFVGHLAGIVAGFLLHWNLLPLEFAQPEVLIPGMYLIILWRARNVIPVRRRQDEEDDVEVRVETPQSSGRFDARRNRRERDQAMQKLLVFVRAALVVNVVLSAFTFDVMGGMFLSPLIGLAFYQASVQSHNLLLTASRNSTDYEHEKSRLGTLWKGFILSCVLTIVCDSMSFSGWITSSVYWQSNNGTSVGLAPACVMLVFRLGIQVVALVVTSKNLGDIGETGGGLFVVVLGTTVLENARIVGTALFSWATKSKWTAFEGPGLSLGSANVSAESATSQVV